MSDTATEVRIGERWMSPAGIIASLVDADGEVHDVLAMDDVRAIVVMVEIGERIEWWTIHAPDGVEERAPASMN